MYHTKRKRLKHDVKHLIDKCWVIEDQIDNPDINVALLTSDFKKDIDAFVIKYSGRLENFNFITDDLVGEPTFRKLFIVVQKLQYFIADGIIRFKKKDNFIIKFLKKQFFEKKNPEYVV